MDRLIEPARLPGDRVLIRSDAGPRFVEVHAVNERDGATYYWLIFPDRTLRIYRANEVE